MQERYLLRLLAVATFFFLLNIPLNASVAPLGSATFASNTNTHSFTVPAGSDRILLVVASDENAIDISTVTFGASSMVQRAEHNDGSAVDSIWTLSLGTSAVGTTATITVVSTGTTPAVSAFIGAAAFSGVSQTTPISNVQMVNNTTIPSASTLNIVSATGNLVFDVFDTFTNNLLPTNTVTPGASQTTVHNTGTTTLGAGGFGYYRTSIGAGAASVPMSWTSSNGVALIHIGVNINASPTAAGVSVGGRILTSNGNGIRNALVSITDSNGTVRTVQTGSFGYFRFEGIVAGQDYTLQVFSKRFSFSKTTRSISVNDDVSDADFIAEPK